MNETSGELRVFALGGLFCMETTHWVAPRRLSLARERLYKVEGFATCT